MNKKIGIIGCGWLGLPLAESLIVDGYEVRGTSTSREKLSILKEKDISPFYISLSENKIDGEIEAFLESLSVLIINVPPKLRGKGPKQNYFEKIKRLHSATKKMNIKNIIFASSTAVYGDAEGIVNENTAPKPTTASGIQLLQCEELLRNDTEINTTIIRFGGLIGPTRHPVTMLSGRENLSGGNAPVNLIHLDDCIGIIKAIITHAYYNELMNAVYPEHPTKEKYYGNESLKRGLIPPRYISEINREYKLISSCSPFFTKRYHFLTTIN